MQLFRFFVLWKINFVLDPYFGELSDPDSLINYIYTPLFLKTKIDVLYFDILNWEKYDLLDIDLGLGTVKTDYKKTAISFVQYVWIKMVEALIKYGFSYDDIRAIRAKLSQKLHFELNYNQKIADNKALQTSDNHKKGISLSLKSYVLSQSLIKITITFFFYKDVPADYFLFADDLLEMFHASMKIISSLKNSIKIILAFHSIKYLNLFFMAIHINLTIGQFQCFQMKKIKYSE